MNAKKYPHKHPNGGEGSLCPACRKGFISTITSLGGEPMILECPTCKTRFYKNSIDELIELGTKEMIEENKEYEKNKKPGKPQLPKYNE